MLFRSDEGRSPASGQREGGSDRERDGGGDLERRGSRGEEQGRGLDDKGGLRRRDWTRSPGRVVDVEGASSGGSFDGFEGCCDRRGEEECGVSPRTFAAVDRFEDVVSGGSSRRTSSLERRREEHRQSPEEASRGGFERRRGRLDQDSPPDPHALPRPRTGSTESVVNIDASPFPCRSASNASTPRSTPAAPSSSRSRDRCTPGTSSTPSYWSCDRRPQRDTSSSSHRSSNRRSEEHTSELQSQ